MAKRITFSVEQKAEVIARYQLGYTARFISDQTGIGWESVRTIIKRHKGGKPSKDEQVAVETAKNAIRRALETDLSNIIDSSLREALATQQRIRMNSESLLDVMEKQVPADLYEASTLARSIAALATATKSGADFVRVLRKEIHSGDSGIEEFTITDLTTEDIDNFSVEQLIAERMRETTEKETKSL